MINNINYYFNNFFIIWQNKNKIIKKHQNSECPIFYTHINYNDKYCICNTCKYNYLVKTIQKWFKQNENKTCPLCLQKWNDFTVYTNKFDNKLNTNFIKKINHIDVYYKNIITIFNKNKIYFILIVIFFIQTTNLNDSYIYYSANLIYCSLLLLLFINYVANF
jgi:hypothetical protein